MERQLLDLLAKFLGLALALAWMGPVLAHQEILTWRDAEVSGSWKGFSCTNPEKSWDKNWETFSSDVGLSNGIGDTLFVNYTWHPKGDWIKPLGLEAWTDEWAICDPGAGRLYAYNFAGEKWEELGHAGCGRKTFGKKLGPEFLGPNGTVALKLESNRGTENEVYEIWADQFEYWYNWLPGIHFNLKGSYWINETDNIKPEFKVSDRDNDTLNYTWHWETKTGNLSGLENLDFNLGDKITLVVQACDPYNCTQARREVKIVNFKPRLEIPESLLVQGNKTLGINVSLNDLAMENQTHTVNCSLGDWSWEGNAILGKNHLEIRSPENEGDYPLKCQVCDGLDCTESLALVTVDNTPPKFLALNFPDLVGKKSISWKLDEPGTILFSCDDGDYSENLECKDGNHTLCLVARDLAGNLGEPVCKNVTVDMTPPHFLVPHWIFKPGQPVEIAIEEDHLANASGFLGNRSICNLLRSTLVCNSSRMNRGNNSLILEACDLAGNHVKENATIRVNLVPRCKARINHLFADSKIKCEPTNISNEPDQGWNYTVKLWKNGQELEESYSLKKGDIIKCQINITDDLGEWSLAETWVQVKNKPPEVSIDWSPKFPDINEPLTVRVKVWDIDGDNVSWSASLLGLNWSRGAISISPAREPGTYPLTVIAWDGENKTTIIKNVTFHHCGNSILEPGEECDGSGKNGFDCVRCELVRIVSKSNNLGSEGGGGSPGAIATLEETKERVIKPVKWIDKLIMKYWYKTTSRGTRTFLELTFNLSESMEIARLEMPVTPGFKARCNVGTCHVDNGKFLWEASDLANGTQVKITLESNKEELRVDMERLIQQIPTMRGEPAEMKNARKPSMKKWKAEERSNWEFEEMEIKSNDSENFESVPILGREELKLGTRSASITGLVLGNDYWTSLGLTLAILILGIKYRRNLRRLGIRLYAMTTKVRPTGRYPMIKKEL